MNDSTSTTSSTSPTPTDGAALVVPPWACPPWCGGPVHHYFEPRGEGLDSSRTHELVLIDMLVRDPLEWRLGSHRTTAVTVCQEEVIRAGGAGGVVRESPFILLTSDWGHLDAEEARRLGDALLAAADRLDSIASASAGQQR